MGLGVEVGAVDYTGGTVSGVEAGATGRGALEAHLSDILWIGGSWAGELAGII